MVYKFFDKKSTGSGIANKQNIQLAKELHKAIIRNFKKRAVHSSFKDSIWGADLADMDLISLSLSLIKGLDFYYALLIFLVNMLWLFL